MQDIEKQSEVYVQVREELEKQLLSVTDAYLSDLKQIQVEFQYGT